MEILEKTGEVIETNEQRLLKYLNMYIHMNAALHYFVTNIYEQIKQLNYNLEQGGMVTVAEFEELSKFLNETYGLDLKVVNLEKNT